VNDTRYRELREPEGPAVYVPESQNPAQTNEGGFAAIVTRSNLALGDLTGLIRREVADIDPRLRVNAIVPLKTRVLEGLARERVLAWLSGFFGALAVVLAAVGIYGVISYIVTGRRKEIGIRLALGSSRAKVVQLVLLEVTLLLGLGLMIGSALSFAASRSAGSLLFGVRSEDPMLYAAAAGFLLVVAGAAAFAPALRAARTNPSVVVIRDE
jgi:ABC-type antimicrobial peptide transport system permease subunit